MIYVSIPYSWTSYKIDITLYKKKLNKTLEVNYQVN